uniref:RRM domain-containing protein n=1 Tax=Wuchereria bancrofti TaxID=6293 RepID=A0A1I8EE40_WUCBA
MGADEPRFRVLHVSNISMTATREQIYQLFAFIGRIDEFKIYPSDNHPQLSTFTQKFAYVKFEDQKSVEVAQHLTNTVFIDRALVCIPSISDTIPDEDTALKTGGPAWPGQRQLPPNVVNQIKDLGDGQQMTTTDQCGKGEDKGKYLRIK